MAKESSMNDSYYLIDQDAKQIIRGPYQYAETAAAVRSEIERYTNTNHNLIIRPVQFVNDLNEWASKL